MLRRLGILALIIAAACSYPPLPNLGGGSNGGACLSDIDCEMPGFPICNTDKSTCAPCFAKQNKSSCPSTAPHCDVDSCTACVDDTDCPGSVCMPDGSCADPAGVIHVLVNGENQAPCGSPGATTACKLDAALMVAASDGTMNVIKVDDTGMYMSGMNNFVVNANVTIDLHGATLIHHFDGPIVTIAGGKTVTLLGGTIMGAHGAGGSAISCSGAKLNVDQTLLTMSDQLGIDASGCMLAVTRAKIENNGNTGIRITDGSITLVRTWLDTNNGGGVDVHGSAQFTIVGNIIVNNGMPGGIVGGVAVATTTSNNRMEFNSIAENKSQTTATVAPGILCTTADVGFVAKNNIVWNNNSMISNAVQVLGCAYSYSDIRQAAVTGPGNQSVDPKFKAETSDLHLTSASPLQLLQQSDPGTSFNDPKDPADKDIDGDPRVAPAYIGADQYNPSKS